MKRIALVVAVAVLSSTCTAYKAQHSGPDPNTTRTEEAARQVEVAPAATTHFEAQPLANKQAILDQQPDMHLCSALTQTVAGCDKDLSNALIIQRVVVVPAS